MKGVTQGEQRGHRFLDKTGQRFGKLLVIACTNKRRYKGKSSVFLVRCDCGVEKEVATNLLTPPGSWHSCGAQACRPKKEPAASRYCRCGCGTLLPQKRGRYVPEHRPQPPWTAEQDETLRRLYHTMPIAKVAKVVGRSVDSTYVRVYALQIGNPDGFESLRAAASRVGVDPKALKKRLAAFGVKAGYVKEDGQTFQARVRSVDIDRAMAAMPVRKRGVCGRCGGEGHDARTCGGGRSAIERRTPKQRPCRNCGEPGHYAKTCPGNETGRAAA